MRATLRLTEIIPDLHMGMSSERAHEVILAEVERLRNELEVTKAMLAEEERENERLRNA